ncbi:MAG TPA: succinate--CoA ligase subunit alpha [Chthonomonadaceae bacterium]|nr:succinate--CoA ligase subunit alpha [Chthonomonadaceae bacterium]
MSILIDANTRVLVQGITGRDGGFHTQQMIEYGTKVVGGVTPGKGGQTAQGVPVFNTMREAVKETGANASCIFVPARLNAADAILEAADAGIELVVCISENVPTEDMIKVNAILKTRTQTRLIGPNCPGLISPGKCKIGIIPGMIFTPGPVGLVSRSGTLTYEIADELTRAGMGQSSGVGIGGDPMIGTTFVDVLPLFEADPQTEVVVMVGEIGGSDEEAGAEYIKRMTKPVVGFIGGRTAPPGKRMGHAGAIISGTSGTPQAKVAALEAAGVPVADTTHDIPELVRQALAKVRGAI